MKKLFVVSIAVAGLALALTLPVQAQGRVGQIQVGGTPRVSDADAARPVPLLPDGTVDFTGPWLGGGSNGNIERDAGLEPGELPLLPWARELRDTRLDKDEPYTACLPMGVPRHNPYPWKMAMTYTSRGLTHIYILHETGDAGAHRVVYVDGREHPEDPIPTWWGHSIGEIDENTLTIDTIGYNDKFWFDSDGTPHTEQLHTIERWTRNNFGTMTNVFTLDDPGAFSRSIDLTFQARHIRPDLDLMEFICAEQNEYGAAAGIQPGLGTSIK